MSLSVPNSVIDAIRFEANYVTYDSMVMRLDPIRFRGLGAKNREKFIRHAVTVSDEINLHFVSDVAYLMFVMTFLGSYFYEDIRYSGLAAELSHVKDGADTRIERFRAQFIAIGRKFIGRSMEFYLSDLDYFRGAVLPAIKNLDASQTIVALAASHGQRSYAISPYHQRLYLQQAHTAVDGLGFGGEDDLKLCAVLGYWLGSGFWKDPLYPWVKEIAATDGAQGVMNYALRRMDRQLKPREDSDG